MEVKRKRIFLAVGTIVLASLIPLILFAGRNIISDLESEANYQVSQFENYTGSSISFVNNMALVAHDHFANTQDPNKWYYELDYNSESDYYYLNMIENTELESDVSTLTGTGQVPTSEEMIQELNLAFKFNPYFKSFADDNESISNVYYVSESNFLNVYPYIPPEQLVFNEEVQQQEYYINALPENNPSHEATWSSVYKDSFDNKNKITISIPIYDGDDFKGVVAVDYIVSDFQQILTSQFDTYVCDPDGTIITTNNQLTEDPTDVESVTDSTDLDLGAIVEGAEYPMDVEFIDGDFVYATNIENTDWIYVATISLNELVLMAIRDTLPIILLILIATVVYFYISRRREQNELQSQNELLEEMVAERNKETVLLREVTIDSVTSLTENRDNETGNHIIRTKQYVKVLGEVLARTDKYGDFLTAERIQELYMSAPLHDIGKVGIRDSILKKPGKLTDEEFEEMKTHTLIGYNALLKSSKKLGKETFLDCAIDMTRSHHEKWDGSGYPDKLAGEAIPLSARIMAVADVYDALRCKRVYKDAMSHEDAVKIIVKDSGTHFAPDIVDAFIQSIDKFEEIAKENPDI